MIFFAGSVFSPRYAAARERGAADPEDFCALNVALHGPAGDAWVMREGLAPERTRDRFALGASVMTADADGLTVDLDAPRTRFFGRPAEARLRGRLRLHPTCLDGETFVLAEGQRWSPVAPRARVEVALDAPRLRFSGTAYHDANAGEAPLERAFQRWQWLRWADADFTRVRYAGVRVDGTTFDHGLRWDAAGRRTESPPVGWRRVAPGRWGVRRDLPADLAGGARTGAPRLRTLLDAPFYNRTLVEVPGAGAAMHESVDLRRFGSRWVRALLPFRIHAGPDEASR